MKKNLFDLNGKVVVITGACGVLGRSIVPYFAEQGARVVLLSRSSSAEKAERMVADIKNAGGEAMFCACDVMDKASLEACCQTVLDQYGTVDVLLNAAGGNMPAATVPPDKTIFDLDVEAVRKVVDLNLFGTIIPTLVFARVMADNKKGSIINFCSESSFRPLSRVAGYGAAKSAVANWTKYLAGEMALKFGDGIRVNGIAPGFILSEQNRALLTNPDGSLTPRSEKILGHTPFGRFLEPEELLGTLHYLASDASAAVTGTISIVDGGFESFSI